MDATKTPRSQNFSKEEEEILANLVKKYAHVIECKVSNTVNNGLKEKMWQTISSEFNSLSTKNRTPENLSTKWKNLKKRTKKKRADKKVSVKKTGGGVGSVVEFDSVDDIIENILKERITGRNSAYDDDKSEPEEEESDWRESLLQEQEVDDVTAIENISIHEYGDANNTPATAMDVDNTPSTTSTTNITPLQDIQNKTNVNIPSSSKSTTSMVSTAMKWKGNTTALLKRRISTPLQIVDNSGVPPGTGTTATPKEKDDGTVTKRRKQIQDQMTEWARGKAALNSITEKFLEKEHLQRTIHLQDQHEKKMQREERIFQLEEEERKLKIQVMQEQHTLDMKRKQVEYEIKVLEKQRLMDEDEDDSV